MSRCKLHLNAVFQIEPGAGSQRHPSCCGRGSRLFPAAQAGIAGWINLRNRGCHGDNPLLGIDTFDLEQLAGLIGIGPE